MTTDRVWRTKQIEWQEMRAALKQQLYNAARVVQFVMLLVAIYHSQQNAYLRAEIIWVLFIMTCLMNSLSSYVTVFTKSLVPLEQHT